MIRTYEFIYSKLLTETKVNKMELWLNSIIYTLILELKTAILRIFLFRRTSYYFMERRSKAKTVNMSLLLCHRLTKIRYNFFNQHEAIITDFLFFHNDYYCKTCRLLLNRNTDSTCESSYRPLNSSVSLRAKNMDLLGFPAKTVNMSLLLCHRLTKIRYNFFNQHEAIITDFLFFHNDYYCK